MRNTVAGLHPLPQQCRNVAFFPRPIPVGFGVQELNAITKDRIGPRT